MQIFDANNMPFWRIKAPTMLLLPLCVTTIGLLMLLASMMATPASTNLPSIRSIEVAPASSPINETSKTAWRSYLWWQLPHLNDPHWIKATFTLAAGEVDAPASALRLSGPFSATVWLNDNPLGEKGTPGGAADEERAGKIDAAFYLGTAAQLGDNTLLIKTSAHQAGYKPARLFHDFSISSDLTGQHRDMRRYVGALSHIGLIVAAAIFFVWSSASSNKLEVFAAAAASTALAHGLFFEVSRSLINYDYNLHGLRQFLIWFSLFGFGAFTVFALAQRFFVDRAALYTGTAIVTALTLSGFQSGGDAKSMMALVVFVSAGILIMATKRSIAQTAPYLCVFMMMLVYMFFLPRQFLDNGVYMMGSLLLGVIALKTMSQSPLVAPEAPPENEIVRSIFLQGMKSAIPAADIISVKAAGNYAEIISAKSANQLIRQPVREIEQTVPTLTRIHRSHLANLDYAENIRRGKDGRYWLDFTSGGTAPVSRNNIKALKEYFRKR